MLIDSQPDLDFVGAAVDGVEAVSVARSDRPDVMLMDIRMPIMDGIAATRAIRGELGPDGVRIIVLTTFDRDEAVAAALRAGADGFLLKDATVEFILASIRAVYVGHAVVAPKMASDLLRTLPRRNLEVIQALSVREKDVFLLAARGLSNEDIGSTAFIAEATVKSHIRSILSKLQLASRVQLVAFAYENGLVR